MVFAPEAIWRVAYVLAPPVPASKLTATGAIPVHVTAAVVTCAIAGVRSVTVPKFRLLTRIVQAFCTVIDTAKVVEAVWADAVPGSRRLPNATVERATDNFRMAFLFIIDPLSALP